ncbi:MAG: hypothetical protein R2828_09445 [Saprospiraceae bacterium]
MRPLQEEKKVLIINWKWKQFQNGHINENVLSKEEFAYYTANVEEGRGKFYEEYEVEESTLCTEGLVVATSIYKETENTQHLLYALIDKYAQKGNRVMVFLHRSNFYKEKDVDQLLGHFNQRVAKCFLFAFGRDYIYFNTRQSGFLNDTGGFFRGRDPISDEKVVTFDQEKQLVKQPYFDRVWQYYETEFEIKILNLKEELFDCWLPYLLPGSSDEVARASLLTAVRNEDNNGLFFRLKSFLGKYEKLDEISDFEQKNTLEKELDIIKRLEKDKKESFMFDDCIVNLEHDNKSGKFLVKEVYDQAKQKINDLLFESEKTSFDKQALKEVASSMEELIKVVPGEID